MIDSIGLGPPAQGIPGATPRDAVKPSREESSGSFTRTLGERINPKISSAPRERKPGTERKERDDGPPEVKAEKSPAPERKRATGAREQAIREFMDSFESEFRIPPTRIVEAMASIEPQKLDESPEETAAEVIDRLDLDPEDREQAMAMYAGLLANLKAIDRSVLKPAAFTPTETAVSAPEIRERLLFAKDKRAAINHSVDSLNQKFWMTDSRMKGAEAGPARMGVEPGLMKPEFASMREAAADADDAMIGLEGPVVPASGESPSDGLSEAPAGPKGARKATPEEMKRVMAEMRAAVQQAEAENALARSAGLEGEASSEARLSAAAPLANGTNVASAKPADAAADATMNAKAFMVPTAPKGEGSFLGGKDGGSSGSKGGGEGSGSKEPGSLSMPTGTAAPVPLKLEDVAAALRANPAPVAAPIAMSPAEKDENIRQIMNQAEYLIKRGGGEMKVEMSPEGLGQLQLKVLVQDGKVNVQMAAESSEAKKALESSISELRSSLAAHKLSVDHVKVDVVSAPGTDNQARNDTNNPNQQHRETRQFWNGFQENFGNRGAREGLWSLPDMGPYRKGKSPDALRPSDEVTAVASRKATRADGRGRSVDFVA